MLNVVFIRKFFQMWLASFILTNEIYFFELKSNNSAYFWDSLLSLTNWAFKLISDLVKAWIFAYHMLTFWVLLPGEWYNLPANQAFSLINYKFLFVIFTFCSIFINIDLGDFSQVGFFAGLLCHIRQGVKLERVIYNLLYFCFNFT